MMLLVSAMGFPEILKNRRLGCGNDRGSLRLRYVLDPFSHESSFEMGFCRVRNAIEQSPIQNAGTLSHGFREKTSHISTDFDAIHSRGATSPLPF